LLDTAKAWEMLHDPDIVPNLKADPFYELCLRAGYSEDAAQKAATAHANHRLDRNLAP
jgi:hypothetical protein